MPAASSATRRIRARNWNLRFIGRARARCAVLNCAPSRRQIGYLKVVEVKVVNTRTVCWHDAEVFKHAFPGRCLQDAVPGETANRLERKNELERHPLSGRDEPA